MRVTAGKAICLNLTCAFDTIHFELMKWIKIYQKLCEKVMHELELYTGH